MKLKLKDVVVRIGSRDILREVTFEVGEGELIALLGPNGSGKSTILRTIFGILKPVKGVVMLDGKSLGNVEETAKKLGYLPQETPVTNLKVLDIVLLGRTPYMGSLKKPNKKDYDIALKAIHEVGLENFATRSFSELSGGEKQKVMLARVFAQEPKLMLLDEPTAHLDITAQIEIMHIIRKKVESGSSAIVAIHDINLASSFATQIFMVKGGKIAYAGKAEEIITEESIMDIFGANVSVRRHGRGVYIVPKFKVREGDKKIHVICGGGSGRNILYMLKDAGYKVSAGVINVLDSDWEVISEIGEVVDEAPFSQISESSYKANIRMIDSADVVVLSNLSIGKGNLKNLLSAKYACDCGKLVVVHETDFNQRNFAGDFAETIYSEILEKAVVVCKEGEVVDAVRRLLGGG